MQNRGVLIRSGEIPGSREGLCLTCASKYSVCCRTCGDIRSGGRHDGPHGRGLPELEQSLAVGGHVLVMAGAEAEKVAQFIVSPAEPGGRSRAFEAPHGPVAAFDAAVILLQPVVQVADWFGAAQPG